MIATNYETLVLEVTQKLGEKLSTVAPHVWEVMVRQSIVWGWTSVGTWALGGVVAGFMSWLAWFKFKYPDRGEEEKFLCVIARTIVSGGSLAWVVVGLVQMPGVLTAIVNPEYRAMMSLIGK